MKHRPLASANLRRFIGATALAALIVPTIGFADAADVAIGSDKKAVGDRLTISDYNQLIDILAPINVDGSGVLTTEGNLIIGTGGDFTVTDGATTLGGTTATTGLLSINGGVTVEDGDTVTINGVGLTDIETYAEGLAGTWATVSNPLTDLSSGYDTQLATMGWSAGLLKYQMTNLDISYFNGFKAIGTPATGDLMVWDATADGGAGSWVAQNSVPDDFTVGDAGTDTFTVNATSSFTDAVGMTSSLDVAGTTSIKDLTITSDTTPVNLVLVDNTEATPSVKFENGTDFAIYSDAGTTDTFTVDAATGNTAVAGTFGATGAALFGDTVGITGIVTANAGIVVDATTFDNNGMTTTGANDFSIATADDQDIVLNTGGTGGVSVERLKVDGGAITTLTEYGPGDDAAADIAWAADVSDDTAVPTTKMVNYKISGALSGGSSGTFTDLTVTGATALNGGLTMDTTAFTVANETGNVHTDGTLDVDGATTLDGAVTLGDALSDVITFAGRGVGVIQSDASGVITSSSTLAAAITAPGITMTGDISMGSNNISAGGTFTATTFTDGTASITGGDISGVGDIDATTGTIATFDSTAATINSLVLTASTAVTATAEGVADNDQLTTKGYVDDAVALLSTQLDLDSAALGTCDLAAEGNIKYNNAADVGTFWGCAETGTDVFTWVALSIFES